MRIGISEVNVKILFIGHERDINGASKSLLNIVSQLEEKHQIYILTAYDSGEFYDELKKYKVEIIVCKFYHWKAFKGTKKFWITEKMKYVVFHNLVNHLSAKKMANYVIENKIDVIHSNTSVINIGGLINKYSGVSHVWHIREFGDLDFDMYPLVERKRYTNFMNSYADRFILISKAVYRHYNYLDETKKRLIYNGVDQSYLIQDKLYNTENIVFLISGRVSKEKGQQEAIEAAKILNDRGIYNFKLLIAGYEVEKLNIPQDMCDKVEYIGTVKDMRELRKKVDVELVCSVAEAFGRVTVEAMLGGIPVIGSNTGGTMELIRDGINGFLYEKGNAEDLADKMVYFINNPKKLKEFGEKGREYALQNFKIERCTSEIEKLYEEVINGIE